MPTVEYLEDLQTHKKGDQAWLDANSAEEQAALGVLKVVAQDEELSEDEQREQTARFAREAIEAHEAGVKPPKK